MHEPTARVQRAERSSIRVMYNLAESTDRDLVRLEVGEPDFDTPEHVIDAATAAAKDGATTSSTGLRGSTASPHRAPRARSTRSSIPKA